VFGLTVGRNGRNATDEEQEKKLQRVSGSRSLRPRMAENLAKSLVHRLRHPIELSRGEQKAPRLGGPSRGAGRAALVERLSATRVA